MARPSKKKERTEQVMQAFQRCVARYGLEGTTLERIAEESGLQRSLVRHFVGNREDMVRQLAEWVQERSDQQWRELQAALPQHNRVQALLMYLFDYDYTDSELMMLVASLTFAAGRDEYLRQVMQVWVVQFSQELKDILHHDYPQASEQNLDAVAFGLTSLYLNLDSLQPLALVNQYRDATRDAAMLLVEILKG
ncbi:TetR/AcrR family transcriptional regulator [Parendozoicomonas haliclonae]|uniref:Transcriptional regulator BetI n=1 Tax=Parendozoicomonas haliclonae TaxID=1960125 RepID=A0A1X7ANS2_9GAMM|nr:TetR/AcrR family transcriptional regulator [Parendozoicomonas haliclonae]SMA49936.1 transcriptional regulator BetI [Parendozoicomonas haliclonae]